nr:hypothetical protein K-LCC10_0213 [Kaumoebavirus]
MDSKTFTWLCRILPAEIIAIIDNELIASYKKENGQRVGTMVKEILLREGEHISWMTYLLPLYKRDPNSATVHFVPYVDVCAVCGDPLEISSETQEPFWVDGTYDTFHLRKSHGRNCLTIAMTGGFDRIDLRAIRQSYDLHEWYY